MKLKFFTSLLVPILAVSLSILVMDEWIADIEKVFGYFTWVIIVGMVLIPCFYSFFVTTTLLFKQKEKTNMFVYPQLTIIVPVYNEEISIYKTLNSIVAQDYPNKIQIIVTNDGSLDNSTSEIKRFIGQYNGPYQLGLIDNFINRGKSAVLNDALDRAIYETIITIDSDTTLYTNALINLVRKFLSDDYAAVAGSIRVNNRMKNFMTRVQHYDYIYGIAAVKRSQSLFNTTLVAQGAFSIYKKEVLCKYRWSECIGEDIVLSWDMLKAGHKIGFAIDAIGFTNVPESYKNFFKQRKRWSVGLIEAFRRNKKVFINPSLGLPFFWNNLLFVYIDLSFVLFFIPSILAATFFKFYLMAGIYTLLLIPLGITLSLPIIVAQYRLNKRLGLPNKLDLIGFICFVLFYQIIQTPACLTGYISEILKLKKSWGTRN